jgi:hypothetical protein
MKLFAFNLFVFTLFICLPAIAQTDTPIFKGAIKANREKAYSNVVKNSIIKNLSLPLTDSTEENWADAFYAMEVIHYKQLWVNEKIKVAFDSIEKRSDGFQRALMELIYTNYKTEFRTSVRKLFLASTNAKVFAMCAEYLLRANPSKYNIDSIGTIAYHKTEKYFQSDESSAAIAFELLWPIFQTAEPEAEKIKLKPGELINSNFLKGNTVVFSIQRKNRDYPGIAIVRNKEGNFIKTDSGKIFAVPQLARSITNMPCYLTNGNTPQGIFRMNGFAVSKSAALGPTENIQLMMPFETSVQDFLKDSSITDTAWTPELYESLLPAVLQRYHPLSQSYYASAIGRTEIIAHGTTVDPEYYNGQTYYPYTPTQGCLCTKEIWSLANGKRVISDQQKLVDAVKKAGGADGYLIVIEIDDQQKPVGINEILPYLKK